TDLEKLFLFNCIVGDRPMYPTLRCNIPDNLTKIDFVEHYKASPVGCQQSLLFTSSLAISSASAVLINKVWDECLNLSTYLATQIFVNEKELMIEEQLALGIADVAVRLSSFSNEQRTGIEMFISKLSDV